MRTHPSSLSFVTKQPEPRRTLTDREAFLAAHPAERELEESAIAEVLRRHAELKGGVIPLATALRTVVSKAEEARQIGVVLVEFVDRLPGKKLTRDFYERDYKHKFVDATGQQFSFELLEWYIATARKNLAPIADMGTALKFVQPLLLTSGEPEFQLSAEPPPTKNRIPPRDDWGKITAWFEQFELESAWQKVKQDPKLFRNGHLLPELRVTLAEELRPKLAVIDEMREELGL